MIRACCAATAAFGLAGKAAVAFVGLILLVGAVAPHASPDARPHTQSGAPTQPSNTVILTVPEGRTAGNLTVVDASGREIATLTHWSDGRTAVVTRRGAGPTVGCYHKPEGSVGLLITGTTGETQIQIAADGTARSIASDPRHFVNPPPAPAAIPPRKIEPRESSIAASERGTGED